MTLLKILIVAFVLNLAWEIPHSRLYKTVKTWTRRQYVFKMLEMSMKDALFIVLFYVLAQTAKPYNLHAFGAMSLGFAFVDETISTRAGRWEYESYMPKILGVGLTPLLELFVTGLLTFWIVL